MTLKQFIEQQIEAMNKTQIKEAHPSVALDGMRNVNIKIVKL